MLIRDDTVTLDDSEVNGAGGPRVQFRLPSARPWRRTRNALGGSKIRLGGSRSGSLHLQAWNEFVDYGLRGDRAQNAVRARANESLAPADAGLLAGRVALRPAMTSGDLRAVIISVRRWC